MKKLLLGILLLVLSGCGTITVRSAGRGMLPMLPVPERPTLVGLTPEEAAYAKTIKPEIIEKVNKNHAAVEMYATKLEAAVKKYNAYAEVNNFLVRKELGYGEAEPVEGKEDKP